MKDKQFTNELNTGKNKANQFENVERGQIDSKKDVERKLKLTNNFPTDYYNTFR